MTQPKRYKLGKTIIEFDPGTDLYLFESGRMEDPYFFCEQDLLDMGAQPFPDEPENLQQQYEMVKDVFEPKAAIEPIKTYSYTSHPVYPTDVLVNKVNEIITTLNKITKGGKVNENG